MCKTSFVPNPPLQVCLRKRWMKARSLPQKSIDYFQSSPEPQQSTALLFMTNFYTVQTTNINSFFCPSTKQNPNCCCHGLMVCKNVSEGAMNISLVLLPILLFVAVARWSWMWWQRCCGDSDEDGIGCQCDGDGYCHWWWLHKFAAGSDLKILKLRCSEEEEGGAGSIKPGQEAKCTKCLKAPYLARHASFCAKCSEQVKKNSSEIDEISSASCHKSTLFISNMLSVIFWPENYFWN